LPLEPSDLLRLADHPGLHGAHCTKCDRLFDAFDTPMRLDEAVMRMKGMSCPRCGKRKHLLLLMPSKYREMMEKQIADEAKCESIRQTADKYIPR